MLFLFKFQSSQGDCSIASTSMSSPATSSSGAIQKRLKGSLSVNVNASPSRAGLTLGVSSQQKAANKNHFRCKCLLLDVRPCRLLAPSESLRSVLELECPICQYKSSDPIGLQIHVDNIHFNRYVKGIGFLCLFELFQGSLWPNKFEDSDLIPDISNLIILRD